MGFLLKDIRGRDIVRVILLGKRVRRIPIKSWIFPKFDVKVVKELENETRIVTDEIGIKKRISKGDESIPECYDWPVMDRQS